MEGVTQLDLLKERIEYNPSIFGVADIYYQYSLNEEEVYVIGETPKANDSYYLYDNDEMNLAGTITSVDNQNHTITIDAKTYSKTNIQISICETYDKVLNRLLEDSKYVALSLRFPYQDYSKKELPEKYYNWQLRCCEEIYSQIGTIGIKSYSENGLNWTRDSSYISNELRGEIEPIIGYIVGEEVDNNE